MSKAKTNALDALRALIAERQQFEQWISSLEARKEGTPEHVFERVRNDYRSRLGRVVEGIRSHSEELQLSISTLSSRLVEVARDEDTRREGLQEAELRAAVGEYEPSQWQQIKSEGEAALEKIAADRVSLDSQLGELRAIQKLSELNPEIPGEMSAPAEGSVAVDPEIIAAHDKASATQPPATQSPAAVPAAAETSRRAPVPDSHRSGTAAPARDGGVSPTAANPAASEPSNVRGSSPASSQAPARPSSQTPAGEQLPLDSVATAASAAAASASKSRVRPPAGGGSAARSRSEAVKPDAAKTLKCPECGTANLPTEWYCERCGGELATM